MRSIRAALLGSAFLLFSAGSFAASWFVAPGGSDANAGSAASPFATITKAATVARAGDVINVRGGTYREIVKIASRGTAAAPIVFRSYPGEVAIVDGTGTPSATNLVQLNGAEWVEFTGFDVRNATRIGIAGWGAKNSRITNNVISGSVKGGIWVGYSSFGASYGLTISGNTVRNNVRENQYHATSGGWSQAVGIQRSDRVEVSGNRVFRNDGEGIGIVLSDNVQIVGNEVFDNFSVGIYLDNAQATAVDRNFVYSTGDSRYFRNGYPAHGIGTANETYTDTNPLTNVTITNNIVLRSRWGFFYGNYENGGGLKASTVANNTFYDATHAVLALDAAAHTGSVIENNIFYQATGTNLASVAGSGVTYRTNSWYGGLPGAAAGSGDVVGNPNLVNAGGTAATDYRLAADSPLIDRGTTSAAKFDYWGTARTAPFDIGAHESAAAPVADTQAPTAPGSLSATVNGASSITLRWNASSDNVGVAGYRIYRDGVAIATVGGTSWVNQGLLPSTTYAYTVQAYDAAGNHSAHSNRVTATTAAAADTQAPTAPTALQATATGTSSIALQWTASADNVGVAGYRIYRDGTAVASVAGTSWADSGLSHSTSYSYTVQAYDAAGNLSPMSNTASATTASKRKRGVLSQ